MNASIVNNGNSLWSRWHQKAIDLCFRQSMQKVLRVIITKRKRAKSKFWISTQISPFLTSVHTEKLAAANGNYAHDHEKTGQKKIRFLLKSKKEKKIKSISPLVGLFWLCWQKPFTNVVLLSGVATPFHFQTWSCEVLRFCLLVSIWVPKFCLSIA